MFHTGYKTNDELVEHLVFSGYVKNSTAVEALKKTDRKYYCRSPSEAEANFFGRSPYADSPQPIGYNVTISAPHMHASALEMLSPKLIPGSRALDVGHGTGYVAACMARMVGILEGRGKVVGIEIIKELVEQSKKNVEADDKKILESPNFKLLFGDGWAGKKDEGPFDAIHVGAAAEILPKNLTDQLAPDGLMFIPIGPPGGYQYIYLVQKKADGKVTERPLFGVSYVPLIKSTETDGGVDVDDDVGNEDDNDLR